MNKKTLIYFVSRFVIPVLFLVFLVSYIFFIKDNSVFRKDQDIPVPVYAPDGIPYDIPLEDRGNTIYNSEYWLDEYGHLEDLVCTSFDDVKPYYYEYIDFSDVVFPYSPELCKDFIGFIALDAVKYTYIPEDVMNLYFTEGEKDYWLDLYKNGYYVEENIKVNYIPDIPPVYLSVDIIPFDNERYKVTYSTTSQYYNRYFQKLENGTFEEIKGGWFDVSFE